MVIGYILKFLSDPISPSILLLNARSILPKFDELCVLAASMKPDVIVICESWLSDTVPDNYLAIPHYSPPFRRDRSDGRKGGGVLVYVSQYLPSTDITPPSTSNYYSIEQIWLRISKDLLFIAMYVPPNTTVAVHDMMKEDIVETIDRLLIKEPDLKIILAGDLNQLSITSLERDLDIKNLVDLPTRGSSILDKILIDQSLVDHYSPPIIAPNLGNSRCVSKIPTGPNAYPYFR